MSMIPMGSAISSAAGAPLSQTTGSETERAQKNSSSQTRQADGDQRAERAAGIGQTEQDQETSDRDADGRRFWEAPSEAGTIETQEGASDAAGRQSKDATGQSGTQLDLTG